MLYNQNWEKPTTPAQLLRRAADVMETRGLARKVFMVSERTRKQVTDAQGELGSVCIQGALMVANGVSDEGIDQLPWAGMSDSLVRTAMCHLSVDILEACRVSVPYWNNAVAKDATEVVNKLREVADQLEPA